MPLSLSGQPAGVVVVPPVRAAIALGLLLGLQPLATDLYLPALPMLTRELAAPLAAGHLTMSALILAFGLAQLVWGPVADRFGRRPALLSGLSAYTAASLLCALAGDIGTLVLGRALQGIGMAAAVVCGRAMVRDLYEPQRGAHVMSLGLSGLGMIAIASPLLGGALSGLWGWRATLGFVAAAGAGIGLFLLLGMPETQPVKNPHALRLRPLLALVGQVLANRRFQAWAALTAATYGGLFALLAGSSFIYINLLGLSPGRFGALMATVSVSYLGGTMLCRRWLPRCGLSGAAARGAWLSLAGGVAMALLAAAGVQTVWAVWLPQCVFTMGHGVHQSCGQTGAVAPFPRSAGIASALSGFVLAFTAFLVGLWLGQAMDGSTRPLAYGVCAAGVAVAFIAWVLVRRHGEPPAP
jgi:DHA1 family bicyclomycin/chloramphenicol resistance-like MFS transporter